MMADPTARLAERAARREAELRRRIEEGVRRLPRAIRLALLFELRVAQAKRRLRKAFGAA